MKKKQEFERLKEESEKLHKENKELKEKVSKFSLTKLYQLNEVTISLYKKIEDYQNLQKKMEESQTYDSLFLTKLLLK